METQHISNKKEHGLRRRRHGLAFSIMTLQSIFCFSPTAHASACAQGLWRDPRTQFCTDGGNAFGPFPEALVAACVRQGGGRACQATRWHRDFTENLLRQAPPLSPLSPKREIRGVYVAHWGLLGKSDAEILALAQELANANVNTVYASVYQEGNAFWPSRVFSAAGGTVSAENNVRRWASLFKSKGHHFVAWFESGLRLGRAEHPIAISHPEWLQRDASDNPRGAESQAVFLSPGSGDAMKLIGEMIAELADPSMGIDEIQLDHFHWTHMGQGREMGYENVTSSLYQSRSHQAPPTNVNDAAWVSFRESLLDDAVRSAYGRAKSVNPRVVISAVPEGSYTLTKHMKQWPRWLAGKYIDLVMAQLYFTDANVFAKDLRKLTDLAMAAAPVERFGYVVDVVNNTPEKAESMVALARSMGVHNTAMWVHADYRWGNPARWALKNFAMPQRSWAGGAVQPFHY